MYKRDKYAPLKQDMYKRDKYGFKTRHGKQKVNFLESPDI